MGAAPDGPSKKVCKLCRPYRNEQRQILGYHHKLVLISVVGTGLTLPLDVEPYGPGDSEYRPPGGSCAGPSQTSVAALPTMWSPMGSSPPLRFCTTPTISVSAWSPA